MQTQDEKDALERFLAAQRRAAGMQRTPDRP